MTLCRSRDKARWLGLLFLALLLRALVPQGMMVQPGEGGGVAITLCDSDPTFARLLAAAPSSHAEGHAEGHGAQHGGHHADDGEPQDPCTFAASNAPAIDPGGVQHALPSPAVVRVDALAPGPLSSTSPPRSPSARAPPVPA